MTVMTDADLPLPIIRAVAMEPTQVIKNGDLPPEYALRMTIVGVAEIAPRAGTLHMAAPQILGVSAGRGTGGRGASILGKRREVVTFQCALHCVEELSGNLVIFYVTATVMKGVLDAQREAPLIGTTMVVQNPLYKYGPVNAVIAISLAENPYSRIRILRTRDMWFDQALYPVHTIVVLDGLQPINMIGRIVINPSANGVMQFVACPNESCDRRYGTATFATSRACCATCTGTKIAQGADAINAVRGYIITATMMFGDKVYSVEFKGAEVLRGFAGINIDLDDVRVVVDKSVLLFTI